jgi:hypothetical protein
MGWILPLRLTRPSNLITTRRQPVLGQIERKSPSLRAGVSGRVLRRMLNSAKGADTRPQTAREYAEYSGGVRVAAPVLREVPQ